MPILWVLGLIALVYARTIGYGFLHIDDDYFVWNNPFLIPPLTRESLAWAFGADLTFPARNADYWHPITFVSHMLDLWLYQLKAGGHHLTNILLHSANTYMLYRLARRIQPNLWAAALAAAIFALHPIQAESVSWVTARKDLLATFFLLAALSVRARSRPLSWFFYACCMMSKLSYMLFPVVVWIWEVYGQGTRRTWKSWLKEIVPYALIALLASSVLVFGRSGDVHTELTKPHFASPWYLLWQWGAYAVKLAWPFNYSVFYHAKRGLDAGVIAYGLAQAAVFALTLFASRHNKIARGSLWMALALTIPSIGLPLANRYLYAAMIGVGLFCASIVPPRYLKVSLLLIAPLLAGLSWREAGFWRDTRALVEHSAQGIGETGWIWNQRGLELQREGRLAAAKSAFAKAFEGYPNHAELYNNLGLCEFGLRNYDQAIDYFRKSIRIYGLSAPAYSNLGMAELFAGRISEAKASLLAALKLDGDLPQAHLQLSRLYLEEKDPSSAVPHLKRISTHPIFAEEALLNLAAANRSLGDENGAREALSRLFRRGFKDEAIRQAAQTLRQALEGA